MGIGAQRVSAMLALIAAAARGGLPAPNYEQLAFAAGLSLAGSNVSKALGVLREAGHIRVEKRNRRTLRYLHVESGCWTGWTAPRQPRSAPGGASLRSLKKPAAEEAAPATRRCLRCRNAFAPAHKNNYLCTGCGIHAANASPLATVAHAVRP